MKTTNPAPSAITRSLRKRLSIAIFSMVMVVPSFGAITLTYTVSDATSIMDGATFTAVTPDANTWLTNGSFLVAGSETTVTISDATGDGSIWNGEYDFVPSGAFLNVGYRYNSSVQVGPTAYSASNTNFPTFSDGSGNTFEMRFNYSVGSVTPIAGAAVVPENFGALGNPINRLRSNGGTHIQWSQPSSGGSGAIAVPEPSAQPLLLAIGAIVFSLARRR